MREQRELEGAVASLAMVVDWPRTPPLDASVTSRLLADRVAGVRPPLPVRATWTPRRRLVVIALAVAGLLALAASARYVIGAEEIRVQPGVTPTAPPLRPANPLGEPVSLAEAASTVGFRIELPPGPPPDAIYAYEGAYAGHGVLLAWDAGDRYPPLPGTPWGLVLMETTSEPEIVIKSVNSLEDLHRVPFEGSHAYWIDAPHELAVSTVSGDETFSVRGNVLVWARDLVTYRLESSLSLHGTLAIAHTIG
jgi:hypothetical protein